LATLANGIDSMALCYQGSGGLVMRAARTQQPCDGARNTAKADGLYGGRCDVIWKRAIACDHNCMPHGIAHNAIMQPQEQEHDDQHLDL